MIWRLIAFAIILYVLGSLGLEMWNAYQTAAKPETPQELVGRIMAGDGDALRKNAGQSPGEIAMTKLSGPWVWSTVVQFFDLRPWVFVAFIAAVMACLIWAWRAL